MKAFYAKRSFIRPLLFWVGGVGLQLNYPEIPWALLLSAMVLLLLIGSGWCKQDGFHAGDLFSWGYAFVTNPMCLGKPCWIIRCVRNYWHEPTNCG